jgi:hypothetical protein
MSTCRLNVLAADLNAPEAAGKVAAGDESDALAATRRRTDPRAAGGADRRPGPARDQPLRIERPA